MAPKPRGYRTLAVMVDGERFDIQYQGTGKLPRVYRYGNGGKSQRRVKDDDPILDRVAEEVRTSVDFNKAAEAKELERRTKSWLFKAMRFIGEMWGRVWGWVRRSFRW